MKGWLDDNKWIFDIFWNHHHLDHPEGVHCMKGQSSPSATLIVAQRRVNPRFSRHLFPQSSSASSTSSSASSTTSSSELPYLDHNACSERWVGNERIYVSVTEDWTLRTENKRSVSQSIGHRGKIWSPPQLPPCQPCKCQYPSNIKQLLPIHSKLQLLHISGK